ncbi:MULTISPECIES: GSCFA domain-containing protein [Shewanella]|nr:MULTISPECIES: GSCFA domain-containing protein [Shewanella]
MMQNTPSSPYRDKSKEAFWKSGVVDVHLGKEVFSGLHQINLATQNPRISSIGSCFAQHVGNWLNAGGYLFNQSKIESNQVSSFAFGNLYTPKCLLQWFDIAEPESGIDKSSAIYSDGNRFYDLLRPNFKPAGFGSEASLIGARIEAVTEMIETIAVTDVLIFTLGLTEAWKDCNNLFYPSCPGVISGVFDNSLYSFYNFGYEEICANLKDIATRLKAINPNIKIILTVSPVPLTATATDNHVLIANQYSKSILRSVAGYLTSNDSDFDYFPSYEIITVPCSEDFRFESNRRSVTTSAVNYVMRHFESVLSVLEEPNITQDTQQKDENSQVPISDNDEVVCEEEMLEATRKLQDKPIEHPLLALTLFGDSHMGKLSTSFNKLNIPHSGGMVMNGSAFTQNKFALCDTEYFVPLENAASRKLWSVILDNLKKHEVHQASNKSIIISNVGMQTHQNIARFVAWLNKIYPAKKPVITVNVLVDFFNDELSEQLSILFQLHNNGHKVIVVSDPPFCKYFKESESMTNLIYSYFDAMEYIWNQFGVTFYNAARVFDEEIKDPELYISNTIHEDGRSDWYHGNSRYYTWLAEKLIKLTQ